MKIQVVSDLHLEFVARRLGTADSLITPAPDADVLVIAGDIGVGTSAISAFANWPVPVLYVAGNHEFYRQNMPEMRNKLALECARSHITFLDNKVSTINNVRFLGSTMWTDYQLDPLLTQSQQMVIAENSLNDHSLILAGNYNRFTAQRALEEHNESRKWLAAQLEIEHTGPTVVITHHAPSKYSIGAEYAGSPLNAAFASNLDDLMKCQLWIHGHVHGSFDYQLRDTRVVCNPRGYPIFGATVETVKFENPNFDPHLIVEV